MSSGEKLRFWPPIFSQKAQGRVKRRVAEKARASLFVFNKESPPPGRERLLN